MQTDNQTRGIEILNILKMPKASNGVTLSGVLAFSVVQTATYGRKFSELYSALPWDLLNVS